MNVSNEHITYLWLQLIDNKATMDELNELIDFLKNNPDDPISLTLLQSGMAAHHSVNNGNPEVWAEKLNRILTYDVPAQPMQPVEESPCAEESHMQRIPFLKNIWIRYAAAIVILSGLGTFLWFLPNRKPPEMAQTKPAAVQQVITAGTNRAVLTFSNGASIDLDSASNGMLNQEGTAMIEKTSDGQIRYHSTATTDPATVRMNTLSTPRGGQYKLKLSDGSTVWLNAASSITYPAVFTGNQREVTITGEAYFEVAKNPKKPFHVKTSKDNITVVGTSFNVFCYSNEPAMKTSLLEGSVRIASKVLKPGQAYINGNVTTTNIQQDIAWKSGLFNFDRMKLSDVMRQLARWYDVNVQIRGNIDDVRFYGEVGRNLTLNQVINGLEGIEGLHFTLDERTIFVNR